MTATGQTPSGVKRQVDLAHTVRLVEQGLWPTPTENDSRGGRNRTAQRTNPDSAHHDGLTLVDAVRPWPTPRACDGEKGGNPRLAARGDLQAAVRLEEGAGGRFPTPSARDWKSSHATEATFSANSRPLNEVASGGSGGQLNPTWVEWLMGFPADWTVVEEE